MLQGLESGPLRGLFLFHFAIGSAIPNFYLKEHSTSLSQLNGVNLYRLEQCAMIYTHASCI